MPSDSTYINRIPWRFASYAVIAVGILVRLRTLIGNRSIFIDEANLARNIAERGYLDFFENLSYEQYAPPLFLVETKMLTDLLGNYEWVLRLIPFVAGLGAIWFLWILIDAWLEHPVAKLYAIGLFCFSVVAIRYATEFKQYSGDTFLALAFVWMAWRDRDLVWGIRELGLWAFLGAVGLWYSMPLVFVLTGVGLFFLYCNKLSSWRFILTAIVMWLFSFGIYYFMILRHDIGSEYLENYFSQDFLVFTSFHASDWKNNLKLVTRMFQNMTDKTALSIGFAMILFIWGFIRLLRQDKGKALLLLSPLVVLLVASALHYYPIMDRMLLLFVPIMILVVGKGLDHLMCSLPNLFSILFVALVLVSLFNKKGYAHLWQPMTFEELKPCLEELQDSVSVDDLIFVHHCAIPAYTFYTQHYENPWVFNAEVVYGKWNSDLKSELIKLNHPRKWLIISHLEHPEISEEISNITRPKLTGCISERAAMYLLYSD